MGADILQDYLFWLIQQQSLELAASMVSWLFFQAYL